MGKLLRVILRALRENVFFHAELAKDAKEICSERTVRSGVPTSFTPSHVRKVALTFPPFAFFASFA
jgi:hypothetical protein